MGNKARDRRVNYALRKRGWKVVRIWEHELSRKNEPMGCSRSPNGVELAHFPDTLSEHFSLRISCVLCVSWLIGLNRSSEARSCPNSEPSLPSPPREKPFRVFSVFRGQTARRGFSGSPAFGRGRKRMRSSSSTAKPHAHAQHKNHHHAGDYWPLLALLGTAAFAAAAKGFSYGTGSSGAEWMQDFMGVFLTIFGLVKLFNLRQFADGFQMYDLLGKHFRPYALAYPFIELALGLGYLARWEPSLVQGATVGVLGFGALGVVSALRRGLDVNCACMGNILKVPLSTVALTEDLGMVAMAAWMLMR